MRSKVLIEVKVEVKGQNLSQGSKSRPKAKIEFKGQNLGQRTKLGSTVKGEVKNQNWGERSKLRAKVKVKVKSQSIYVFLCALSSCIVTTFETFLFPIENDSTVTMINNYFINKKKMFTKIEIATNLSFQRYQHKEQK